MAYRRYRKSRFGKSPYRRKKSNWQRKGTSKTSRKFSKFANKVLKTAAEKKGVITSLQSLAGGITTNWTLYSLQVPNIDSATSANVVGRSYYPGGIYFKNAFITGGQSTNPVPDDEYNVIRMVVFETTSSISAATLDGYGVKLDTPFSNGMPFVAVPLPKLKVYYDKTIVMMPHLETGTATSNLTPSVRQVKLNVKFRGKNYCDPAGGPNVFQRKFYIGFLSDSVGPPNPGFILGNLIQYYKDDC